MNQTIQTINLTDEIIRNYALFRAKCKHYEPQADTEGICTISPNQRFVSRLDGCDDPEDCPELKRYSK
jgi:hypothetical protein